MKELKVLLFVAALLAVAYYVSRYTPTYTVRIDDSFGKPTMCLSTLKNDRHYCYRNDNYRIYKYDKYFLVCSTEKIDTFYQQGNLMIYSDVKNVKKRRILRNNESIQIDSLKL